MYCNIGKLQINIKVVFLYVVHSTLCIYSNGTKEICLMYRIIYIFTGIW